jgi:hypothetical protein
LDGVQDDQKFLDVLEDKTACSDLLSRQHELTVEIACQLGIQVYKWILATAILV